MHITKSLSTTLLSSLTLLILLQGCIPKDANGRYHSKYSYDPYLQGYPNTPQKENDTTKRFERSSPLQNRLERSAKSMLGIGYKYGATGPSRYDCSGFTQHVFSKYNIKLPRVSKEQALVGRLIRFNHLQKGDLVFFDSKKSSTVNHVGIYLGNGRFIHASQSQKHITINKITSRYFKKHFKWGRRVLRPQRYTRN